MFGNCLQQTTSADDNSDAFFLGALRVKESRLYFYSVIWNDISVLYICFYGRIIHKNE